jgi:hypothetical protein
MIEGHAEDAKLYISEKVRIREHKDFFNQKWWPENRNHINSKEK